MLRFCWLSNLLVKPLYFDENLFKFLGTFEALLYLKLLIYKRVSKSKLTRIQNFGVVIPNILTTIHEQKD